MGAPWATAPLGSVGVPRPHGADGDLRAAHQRAQGHGPTPFDPSAVDADAGGLPKLGFRRYQVRALLGVDRRTAGTSSLASSTARGVVPHRLSATVLTTPLGVVLGMVAGFFGGGVTGHLPGHGLPDGLSRADLHDRPPVGASRRQPAAPAGRRHQRFRLAPSRAHGARPDPVPGRAANSGRCPASGATRRDLVSREILPNLSARSSSSRRSPCRASSASGRPVVPGRRRHAADPVLGPDDLRFGPLVRGDPSYFLIPGHLPLPDRFCLIFVGDPIVGDRAQKLIAEGGRL